MDPALKGTDRVNAINASLTPNQHDAPGYNPATDPASSAYSSSASIPVPSTIGTSSLTPTTPVSVPTPAPSTAAAPIISTSQANADAQKQAADVVAKETASLQPLQDQRTSALDSIKSLIGLTTTAQTNRATQDTQIDPYRKTLADLNQTIADTNVAYRGEKDAVLANGAVSKEGQQGLLSNIDTKYGRQLADLAIRQSAANQNVSALETAADRKLALTIAPLQTEIGYYKDFLLQNIDNLTQQEKDKINMVISEKNNILQRTTTQQGVANEALKAALTAGAKIPDTVTAQILANPAQAYQILAKNGISLQTNKFTPLPFGSSTVYNPATGETKSLGGSDPNTLAVRNNNPGNLRGADGNFQTFNSQTEGQQALIADLTTKMTGNTSTGLSATSTLQDLANIWAPKSDGNDPVKYAQGLAAQLGVNVNTSIGTLLPRVTEVAAAIAKNEGGVYVDPQAPLKFANTYGIVLSTDQAQKFAQVPDGDKQVVAQIIKGDRAIDSLTTRSGYNTHILDLVNTVDPNFNAVAAAAAQNFQKSPETQKFVANANTASNTVDRIVELSNQVDRGNIQVLNNGVLKVKQGVSDKNATELVTLSGILADELGKILGSGQGSDFAIQLGQSLVNPNLSKEAFAAQASLLKDRIGNKLSEYQSQFRQGSTISGTGVNPNAAFDSLFQKYGGK